VFIAFWEDIKELIIEGFSIIRDLFVNLYIAISPFLFKLHKKKEKDTTKGSLFKNETVVELCKNKNIELRYRKIISTPYRRFILLVIASTIPTGIIGILLDDVIESSSKTVLIPGLCLLITGVLLLIADNIKPGTQNAQTTSFRDASIVGIAQGCATLPGISRSGTTITVCLLCGFEKSYAVKYSFIMSIPAILGAAVLEIAKFDDTINGEFIMNYLVGTVVASIVGYVCIKTMLKIVKDKKFIGFSIYCFIVGTIAIAYHFLCR
jgi:undecaprenyl-diphosphatase